VLCKSLQCSPGESPESNETSRVCVNVLILSLGLGRRACKPDTVHCRVKVCKSKRIKDVRTTDPMESGLAVSFRYQISPPSREIVESSQAVARVRGRRRTPRTEAEATESPYPSNCIATPRTAREHELVSSHARTGVKVNTYSLREPQLA
jgi:hypothetical protein